MLIQEPQQAISSPQLPGATSVPSSVEALPPALQFASAFSKTSSGFSPTSILIEIFGVLAAPATSGPITDGLLLGLAGHRTTDHDQASGLLNTIRSSKSLPLNGSIEVPFIAAEHLILSPTPLLPNHSDGIRLTAYHCMHPFITRQFYASSTGPLTFTEC
jgi:L-serine dehydratase